MKYIFVLFITLIICSSCATLNSLDDMNCKLPVDRSKNFVGKWKVISNDKKFIWRFYSDNRTATLENQYLTQFFDREVFIKKWENDKIDTLRVYCEYVYDARLSVSTIPIEKGRDYPRRLSYLILSNECRKIVMVNVNTQDTLTLKRKQYFYQ